MLHVEIHGPDGQVSQMQAPDESVIGKAAQAEIRLEGWRVAREHARVFRTPSGVLLEDMGAFGGVYVNGSRIDIQYGPLKRTDVIGVGPYKILISPLGGEEGDVRAHQVPNGSGDSGQPVRSASDGIEATQNRGHTTQSSTGPTSPDVAAVGREVILAADPRQRLREFEWRKRVHAALLETMDLRRHDISAMSDDRLRAETSTLIAQIVGSLTDEIPADIDRRLLQKQVLDEAIGLGPLEELLADESVSEIMVNRFDEIYVERAGQLQRHPLAFTGDRAVLGVIERIVAPLGRRIDESSPMVDARLKDGSRVNAIIPPLALKGPCLTIRKTITSELNRNSVGESAKKRRVRCGRVGAMTRSGLGWARLGSLAGQWRFRRCSAFSSARGLTRIFPAGFRGR